MTKSSLAPRPPKHLGIWATVATILGGGTAYATGIDGLTCAASGCLAALTTRIALIDLKLRIILDKDSFAVAGVAWTWIILTSPSFVDGFVGSMINTLIWVAVFQALRFTYRRVNEREGIGFGDVKLIAATAPLLDTKLFALSISISSVMGLIYVAIRKYRKRNLNTRYVTVPLGSLLILTIYLSWLLHLIDS